MVATKISMHWLHIWQTNDIAAKYSASDPHAIPDAWSGLWTGRIPLLHVDDAKSHNTNHQSPNQPRLVVAAGPSLQRWVMNITKLCKIWRGWLAGGLYHHPLRSGSHCPQGILPQWHKLTHEPLARNLEKHAIQLLIVHPLLWYRMIDAKHLLSWEQIVQIC